MANSIGPDHIMAEQIRGHRDFRVKSLCVLQEKTGFTQLFVVYATKDEYEYVF